MSENEMIVQLGNRIELMVPVLKRIEKMLLQQTLLHKEVLNTKETAIYMGLAVSSIYELRRTFGLKGNRPNKGKLYFKREDVYNWMLSCMPGNISTQVTEREKMIILNPEKV